MASQGSQRSKSNSKLLPVSAKLATNSSAKAIGTKPSRTKTTQSTHKPAVKKATSQPIEVSDTRDSSEDDEDPIPTKSLKRRSEHSEEGFESPQKSTRRKLFHESSRSTLEGEALHGQKRIEDRREQTDEELDNELDDIADAEMRRITNEKTPAGKKQTRAAAPTPDMDRPSDLTKDVRRKFDELQEACRLYYLRWFTLRPESTLIRKIWGEDIKTFDWEWETSKKNMGNHHANWKGRSIGYMKQQVKQIIKADSQGRIKSCFDVRQLAKYFADKYSPSSFASVFDFVNGCIDIPETDRTSRLWHFFFKNIFANFAARCKLALDWEADPAPPRDSPWRHKMLLGWFHKMAISDRYEDLDENDLVRVESKTRRRKANEEVIIMPDDDEDYLFVGTPPPSPAGERP